jgi:predicted metal-dependent peptidase
MYRFYKNYLKSTLNQLLFKNSFLALNLLRAKNSLPCLYKGSEEIVTSSITKKTLKYFELYLNPRLKFFANQIESHTLLVSIPTLTSAEHDLTRQSKYLIPHFSDNVNS